MANLDIRTLSFVATASALLLALGLNVVNRVIAKDASLRRWAWAASLSALGYVLLALRTVVPDVLSIVVGNTLLVVGLVWFYRGNCQYQGRPSSDLGLGLLVLATAGLLAYFTYLTPSLVARVCIFSAACALVLFLCGSVLLRGGEAGDRGVRWFVAAIYMVSCTFMAVRALATWWTTVPGQDFLLLSSPIHTFSLAVGVAGHLLLGIGLPLLVATRMQHQLARSESRFRGAFEAAAHGMALVSIEGRFIKVNAALCAMLGYTEAELLATDFQTISHPHDLADDEAHVRALLDGREDSYQMEKRYLHKTGRILWIQLSSSLVRTKEGGPVHFVAQIQDITERKSASERLQTLLDTASDGIHVLDEQGNVVQFSPSFARMLGYTAQEVVQLNVRDWDVQIPHDQLMDRLGLLMRESASFETRHRCKDGTLIDVEINARGMVLDGAMYLYAASRDVTERKLHQRKLEQLLAEQRGMLENDLICLVKIKDRSVVWANRAFEALLGYGRGELTGVTARLFYPDEAAYQAMGAVAYPTLAQGEIFRSQHQLARKDGSLVWVEVSGAVLHSANQESLWGFVDITERRQQEQYIRQSEQRMELALAGADLGMWDLDLSSGRISYNPRLLGMVGYACAELEFDALKVKDLLHPDDWPAFHAAYLATVGGAVPVLDVECRARHKDGHWLWVLCRGKVVERDAQGKALRMAGTNADISERKIAEAKIQELAFYDPLTQLPNRRLMLDRLRLALSVSARANTFGAVLFLDLDNFKMLNDTRGHDVGDLLLMEVARRLQACVRTQDTVARLGGDEFVVVFESLSHEEPQARVQVQVIAEKIRDALAQEYVLGPYRHRCTCSVGVRLFKGTGVPVDALIRGADAAMYQAKVAGRNAVRFHTAEDWV